MRQDHRINVGIGFVTGRKSFKHLIKTYVNSWNESGLIADDNIGLHLLVAYDLKYSRTKPSDYTDLDAEVGAMLDTITFVDDTMLRNEKKRLIRDGILSPRETDLLFGEGYGKKRNILLHLALKAGLDYLIFIDDDEYPVAPVKTEHQQLIWKGQSVVANHLKYIPGADLTHGHHCGYISPIPHLEFDETLTETDFRIFIEAISNDIIDWESIRGKMAAGGITYADDRILSQPRAFEVPEESGAKFISGSNLCFNLGRTERLAPFYNPPGARGEDTFLGTCLTRAKVLKVPCYTFHDGFLSYVHLLHGVLPASLRPITASGDPESAPVIARFLKAAIGWVRYKPLLLYVKQPAGYEAEIERVRDGLRQVLPKLCRRFQNEGFHQLLEQLDYYHRNVRVHFNAFEETKRAWRKLLDGIKSENPGKMSHACFPAD